MRIQIFNGTHTIIIHSLFVIFNLFTFVYTHIVWGIVQFKKIIPHLSLFNVLTCGDGRARIQYYIHADTESRWLHIVACTQQLFFNFTPIHSKRFRIKYRFVI